MSAREAILARRSRFLAASLAALAGDGCSKAPPPPATPVHAAAPAASSSPTSSPAPLDTDGDSVPDADDECPTVAGAPSEAGCPRVVALAPCLSLIVFQRPHFPPGSAKLSVDAHPFLEGAAAGIKDDPALANVEISGHCDAVEEPCPDSARAETVRDALVARGVAASRLTIRAAGRVEPVDSNATAEGRAHNRRVDVTVKK